MSKRKTMGDQVAEQAVEIQTLREKLAELRGEYAVLEMQHKQLIQANNETTDMVNAGGELLGEAQKQVVELREKCKKLEEEVKSKNNSYTYANSRAEKAEVEIEQAHAALDAIPEAISREFEKEFGKEKRALSARFIGTMLAVVRASK